MAARASLLAYGQEPVHRPRHRAAQKQQVPLGVHLHDAEPQLGEVPRPHVPGHSLSFDDARRIGTRCDRAGLAVPRIPVGFGAAAEMMAVHDALEPPTLGHARDLHAVALGEDRDGHRLPGLGRFSCSGRDREALQHPRRRLETRLFTCPARAFAVRLGFFVPKPSWTCDWPTCTTGHGPASMTVTGTWVPSASNTRVMPSFLPISPVITVVRYPSSVVRHCTLISTSTPAGRSSLVRASMVWDRVSRISIRRLCVLSSNCSRLFLSMCGLRSTVHSCRLVGSGMGPETCAPVFSAVRTMSAAA